MDKIVINGGKRLHGTVEISGSKNAALPILIATLLTDEECVIENVPCLADIDTTLGFLTYIGKKIVREKNKIFVYPDRKLKPSAPYDLVRKMRASILVMGPLLARLGKVKVSLPGGCSIGARPVDIHLDGFKKLGARIRLQGGYVKTTCRQLRGAQIHFRFPSVGATENMLLAGSMARGKTVINNAAAEPEIVDLADVLNKMGASITGAGTKTIKISGARKLHGFRHRVIPDRIETVTYILAGAITKGNVILKDARADHIEAVIEKLKTAGLNIEAERNAISVKWVRNLRPVSIKTEVYPGFPTDVQAQWMALMSTVKGKCNIEETVFENRFLHVCELTRLGADLKIRGNKVVVNGVETLSGAPVMVSDLRAGASLVLAGLTAKGRTEILRIYHLDRGYEHLERKLKKLGTDIRRIRSC